MERAHCHIHIMKKASRPIGLGERRVSFATFYNILFGVFPVDHRMVGIVLKHGYILHIYPTSMKDKKNN